MHLGLLDVVPNRGVQREKIMSFVSGLRQLPNTEGDYREKDTTRRECEVKIIGDFEVMYWYDAPVNIIMVVSVRWADR